MFDPDHIHELEEFYTFLIVGLKRNSIFTFICVVAYDDGGLVSGVVHNGGFISSLC